MVQATTAQSGTGRVLALAPGFDPARLALSPVQGFLLSRIDGRTPWRVLREISGLSPAEVDLCLEGWLAEGLLVLAGEPRVEATAAATPGKRAAFPPPPALDAALDIPLDAQKRILEFEARIDRTYHQILGIEPGADVRAVKRAYFELSREFHPDRWFRREVGPFAPRIDRLFKRILEAYEILSDPTTRAEFERVERENAVAVTAPATSSGDAATQNKTFVLPHVLAARMRAVAERRAKARSFFESGMKAFGEERWLEAAGSVRLAIVFDPANEAIRDAFGDVQRRAHAERAKQLLREARVALELRDAKDALRLFEDALLYAPHDAEANHTTARLMLVLGEDPRRAKDYAQRAVELQPDVALHHRTLGQIYAAAGLVANARRALGAALKLDPTDREAKEALRGL